MEEGVLGGKEGGGEKVGRAIHKKEKKKKRARENPSLGFKLKNKEVGGG